MGIAFLQPANLQDLVLYEEDELGRYSRDIVTIASGLWLPLGTVLGRRSADGLCVSLDPAAVDGSQTACGVLLANTDASADVPAVAVVRHAIVKRPALQWPAGITPQQKAAAEAQLQALGVLVRDAI